MPPKKRCIVCSNPHVSRIDAALLAGEMTIPEICRRFGIVYANGSINRQGLINHRDRCLPAVRAEKLGSAIARKRHAVATELVDSEECLVDATRRLRTRMVVALDIAETAESVPEMCMATNTSKGLIELQARLSGQIKDRTVVIHSDPHFAQQMTRILEVLYKFPEAHEAVLAALDEELVKAALPVVDAGVDVDRDEILRQGQAVLDMTPIETQSEPEEPVEFSPGIQPFNMGAIRDEAMLLLPGCGQAPNAGPTADPDVDVDVDDF